MFTCVAVCSSVLQGPLETHVSICRVLQGCCSVLRARKKYESGYVMYCGVLLQCNHTEKYLQSHKLAGFRVYIMGYQVNLYQKSHNI